MIHTTRYPRAEYTANNELTNLALKGLPRKAITIPPYYKTALLTFFLTSIGFISIGYWTVLMGLIPMGFIGYRIYREHQKTQAKDKLNCVCCQSPLHEEIYEDKSFFVCHWCRSFGKTKKAS